METHKHKKKKFPQAKKAKTISTINAPFAALQQLVNNNVSKADVQKRRNDFTEGRPTQDSPLSFVLRSVCLYTC